MAALPLRDYETPNYEAATKLLRRSTATVTIVFLYILDWDWLIPFNWLVLNSYFLLFGTMKKD